MHSNSASLPKDRTGRKPWGWPRSLGRAIASRRPSWFGVTAMKGMLALSDQAVVSGTSFLTTVAVGRFCGPDLLGLYSLGMTFVILTLAALDALTFVPYSVHANRSRGRASRVYAGAIMAQSALFAAAVGVLLLGLGAILRLDSGPGAFSTTVWILALVLPLLMLREFARRYSFAHLRSHHSLAVDAAAASMQLGGIALLAAWGLLSPHRVYLLMGLACTISGGIWLARWRGAFKLRVRSVRPALARNWRFGRWVFGSQMLGLLSSEILMLWLLVFSLGRSASGIFAACMTIVLFSNPLTIGISHVLTPRAARALAQGGPRELRRVVAKITLLLGLALGVFCLVVFATGGTIVEMLYGAAFAGNGWTISVLALGVFCMALGKGSGVGLWALNRPDVNFKSNLVGLTVMLVAAACLIGPWQLLGAAMGMTIGRGVQVCVRWWAFLRVAREASAAEAA